MNVVQQPQRWYRRQRSAYHGVGDGGNPFPGNNPGRSPRMPGSNSGSYPKTLQECEDRKWAGFACNNPDHPEWDYEPLKRGDGKLPPCSLLGPFPQQPCLTEKELKDNESKGGDVSKKTPAFLGGSFGGGSIPWLWIAGGLGGLWFASRKGWI